MIKATAGGSHGVLCVAASLGAFKSAEGLCRRGGTIVLIGLPKGDLPLNIFSIVLRGITVRGSIVGASDRSRLDSMKFFSSVGFLRCVDVQVRARI